MKEIYLREAREQKGLSLRKAAELLGITHPYLSALELGHKKLQQDRAEEIATLYGLARKSKLIQPTLEDKSHFQEWLRSQIQWWDSRFVLPMIPAVSSLITNLYVDPTFIKPDGSQCNSKELIHDFLTDKENTAMLLSGAMGTGKSFFLRVLTLDFEKMTSSVKSEKKYVPILVSLGEYEFIQGSFIQSIVQYYQRLGFDGSALQLESYLKGLVERGVACFLFDGLDEIRDHAKRVEILARFQHLFEDQLRKPGNKLIISGQVEAFVERDLRYEGFELFSIDSWRSTQMFVGCSKWAWENKNQQDRFWTIIQANDTLYQLARWPLFFHLLTTLHSASGEKLFQEMSGLCDACCQVLENSWASARKTFQIAGNQDEDLKALENYGWLKWRLFFIHLMEGVLKDSEHQPQNVKLDFTPAEIKNAWESFLEVRGIQRRSMDFHRLEDLVIKQSRIGPVFYRRQLDKDSTKGITDTYSFIDRIFAVYYTAKALINQPDSLKELILENLRNTNWENLIPLAIQELGRSERRYENKLGEELIDFILQSDDELGMDKKHGIGKFSLFTAMRSIGSFNIDRYWDTVVQPFIDLYLNEYTGQKESIYDRDVAVGYRILGDFSASPRLREYFLQKYEKTFGDENVTSFAHDSKWRLLGAMAKMGEKIDFVVSELETDVRKFAKEHRKLSSEERVNIRRLLWCLRASGRIFMGDETNAAHPPSEQYVARLSSSIMEVVKSLAEFFNDEMESDEKIDFHYWHIWAVIIRAQSKLEYNKDLEDTLNIAIKLVVKHHVKVFGEYEFKNQLIQFLKAAGRHAYVLKPKLLGELISILEELKSNSDKTTKIELDMVTKLLILGNLLKTPISQRELYEQIYGTLDTDKIKTQVDIIRKQETKTSTDFIALGAAVNLLETFDYLLPESEKGYSRNDVVKLLLNVLHNEKKVPPEAREEHRYYTMLLKPYGLPLYDQIYNCLVKLSYRMPVSSD